MTAQNGRECPSERAVVEVAPNGFHDELASDQSQTNFTPSFHVHRRSEVPGEQDTQAPADPLYAPSERHDGSIMCV